MSSTISHAQASRLVIALAFGTLPSLRTATAEPVAVRYIEGVMHAFLELQTSGGKDVAWGETTQVARANRVTSRMMFWFTDGSIYSETTVFSQRGTFRLLSDHLIQKGPSFKQSMDTTVDATKGEITVRYRDKNGSEKVRRDKMDLPPDLANGLILILLKDVPPNVPGTTVSMVATTPKSRLVKLEITPEGADPISVGNIKRKATHYVVKPKLGGVAGAVAPLIGKQPPDIHVWVVEGRGPGFVKFKGPLEANGSIWQIQMAPPAVFERPR
jgi:hypothetical protein